jgi:hypothetical protein
LTFVLRKSELRTICAGSTITRSKIDSPKMKNPREAGYVNRELCPSGTYDLGPDYGGP